MDTPYVLENPSEGTFYLTELIEQNCFVFQRCIFKADADQTGQAG